VGLSTYSVGVAPSKPLTRAEFLCVDLDGTILVTDSLWESALQLLSQNILYLFLLPVWLLKGKAVLKNEIAKRVFLDLSMLPQREELIEFLWQQKLDGRKLILATGADQKIASAIAERLGLFDFVVASNGQKNLTGRNKRDAILAVTSGKAFDYIGNDWDDIPVWKAANSAFLVNPTPHLLKVVAKSNRVAGIFEERETHWASLVQALRLQHWVKNLLVFVPIVMAHQLTQLARLSHVIFAFVAFSLSASAVYVVNDLLDLHADREHPTKKCRPFASGKVPVWAGLAIAPLLFAGGILAALFTSSSGFLGMLCIYIAATTFYSVYAKSVPILDVLFLTGLYLIRILAGGQAANVLVSPWLLAFSMFLMLSLAFTKRNAELVGRLVSPELGADVSRRNYHVQDREVIQQFGVASGYLSVLVLALYINGKEVSMLYHHPQWIWVACPMLLFWISRIWFLANRGKMSEDPVVFAARDSLSYGLAVCLILILLLAS
jgi:4-hydroxybenzoate polyprenyltransferase/phosphoserine phosphatase